MRLQRGGIVTAGFRLLQGFPQGQQQRCDLQTERLQLCQAGRLVFLRPVIAAGGFGKGLQPLLAPDVPQQSIIFQPVQSATGKAAQAAAQPIKEAFGAQAVFQRLQSAQGSQDGGSLQYIVLFAQKQRDLVPGEGGFQQVAVFRQVTADHRHPVQPQAVFQHPLTDQCSNQLAFFCRIFCGIKGKPLRFTGLGIIAIQIPGQTTEGATGGIRQGAGLRPHRMAGIPGHALQLIPGAQLLFIQLRVISQQQGHRHSFTPAQQRLQQRIFIAGEAVEIIQKYRGIPQQLALRHTVGGKPHPVRGVHAGGFA